MSRNTHKVMKVLAKRGGVIVGTSSGSWLPKGTSLPELPSEAALNHLSVSLFNCTCNWWTIRNMVDQGWLEPTGEVREYQLTPKAWKYLEVDGLCV